MQFTVRRSRVIGSFESAGGVAAPSTAVVTTTFDPANTSLNITLSNGNLTATSNAGGTIDANSRSITSHSSGRFYCEGLFQGGVTTDFAAIGIMSTSDGTGVNIGGPDNKSLGYYNNDANVYINNASIGSIATYNLSDIVGMAVDFGNLTTWFRVNGGNWNNSAPANPATNTGGISFASISSAAPFCATIGVFTSPFSWTLNFGASAYFTAAPSGFVNW